MIRRLARSDAVTERVRAKRKRSSLPLLADVRSSVALRGRADRQKLPVVRSRPERESHDAVFGDADFASGLDRDKRVERRSAGADDELANTAHRIWQELRVKLREALVVVIVSRHDNLRAESIEEPPDR